MITEKQVVQYLKNKDQDYIDNLLDHIKNSCSSNDKSGSKIICPIHNIFEQTLNSHIDQKQGCPFCGYELIGHTKTKFQNSCKRNNNNLGIFS